MFRILLLGIVFLLCGSLYAAEINQSAVVKLRVVYQDSKVGYGTGFFYRKNGSIITCYHVIEGASRIEVIDRGENIYRNISILGFSSLHDIAKIKIEDAGRDFPILPLINDSPDEFPDDIDSRKGVMLTSQAKIKPLGITIATDLVKAIHLEELFKQTAFSQAGSEVRLYGIEATVSNGMSGSPVLYDGKVLGVLSGSKSQGGDFAWIIPMAYFKTIKDQKEMPVSDIGVWPKLALMNTKWSLLNEFKRSYVNEGEGSDRSWVEVIYPPVLTKASGRILIRPHHMGLSSVTVGGSQAILQPNGDYLSTIYLNPDQTKVIAISTTQSQKGIEVNESVQMTRLDLGKIPGHADQVHAEAVKTQSLNKDFETAFSTLEQISDHKLVQKAHRYMGESLLKHGRLTEAIKLTDLLTIKDEKEIYIRRLVKKFIELEKAGAAIQFIENVLPFGERDDEYEMIAEHLRKKGEIEAAIEIIRKINDRNSQFDLFHDIAWILLERNRADSAAKILFSGHPYENLALGRKVEMAIWIAHAQYETGNPDGSKKTLNQAFRAAILMDADENNKIADKIDELHAIAIAQHRLNFPQESKETLKAASDLGATVKSQLQKDILFKDNLLLDRAATFAIIGDYDAAVESVDAIVWPSRKTLGYIYMALNLLRANDFKHTSMIISAIEKNREKLERDSESPKYAHRWREVIWYKPHPAWYRSWFPIRTSKYNIERLVFDFRVEPWDTDSSLGLIATEQAISGDIRGCIETLKLIRDVRAKDNALIVASVRLMKNSNWHESYDFAGKIEDSYDRAQTFIEIAKVEAPNLKYVSDLPKAIRIAEEVITQSGSDLDKILKIYHGIIEYLINAKATGDALTFYRKSFDLMKRGIQEAQSKADQNKISVANALIKLLQLFRQSNISGHFNEAADLFESTGIQLPEHLSMAYAIELSWEGKYQAAITYAKMGFFNEGDAMEEIVYVQCIREDFDAARETISLMDESWEKERARKILAGHEKSQAPEKALSTVAEMKPGFGKDNSYWNVAMNLPDFTDKMATMNKIQDQKTFEKQRIEMIRKWAEFKDLQPLMEWLRSGESVTENRRFKAYLGIMDRYR